MARNHFQPKGGRYGVQVAFVSGKQLDAGITANTTTAIPLASPVRKNIIARVTAQVTTVPTDADGTILATLKKFNQVSGVTTVLSSALDLEALTARKPVQFTLLSTLSEWQLQLAEGEYLYVDVVNNSAAIDTQPKELTFTAELLVQE
jgi:hypothetical protein